MTCDDSRRSSMPPRRRMDAMQAAEFGRHMESCSVLPGALYRRWSRCALPCKTRNFVSLFPLGFERKSAAS